GRPAHQVVGEIALLHTEFGARKVLFLDDNATAGRRRMLDICKDLQDRDMDVALGCLGTVVSHSRETAQAMADAGFRWIHFGAESGDDTLLERMGKRTTRAQITQAV